MIVSGLRFCAIGAAIAVVAALVAPALVHATEAAPLPTPRPLSAGSVDDATAAASTKPPETPRTLARTAIRAIIEQEAQKTDLPPDIAEAVVRVESGFDPAVIGGVGEIGLMQVRPGTAAMMGFRGTAADLAKPDVNIHYGVTYLSKAWRLADGDLCRALMKYRAGHREEVMSPLSVTYCNRARGYLASLGSPFATEGTTPLHLPAIAAAAPRPMVALPPQIYARFRQGTPAASRAFWTAHEARIRAITARIESKWRRVASR